MEAIIEKMYAEKKISQSEYDFMQKQIEATKLLRENPIFKSVSDKLFKEKTDEQAANKKELNSKLASLSKEEKVKIFVNIIMKNLLSRVAMELTELFPESVDAEGSSVFSLIQFIEINNVGIFVVSTGEEQNVLELIKNIPFLLHVNFQTKKEEAAAAERPPTTTLH